MDVFKEQLVDKKSTGIDYLKKIGFIFGGIAVAIVFMTIALATEIFVFMIISAIILYFIVMNLGSFSVEYEYIVTNKDLDVDKITGKKSRKRLITVDLKTAEFFGEYNEGNLGNVNATVLATDGTEFDQYLLVVNHKKLGKVAIVFSPNKDIIEAMKHSLPRNLTRGI